MNLFSLQWCMKELQRHTKGNSKTSSDSHTRVTFLTFQASSVGETSLQVKDLTYDMWICFRECKKPLKSQGGSVANTHTYHKCHLRLSLLFEAWGIFTQASYSGSGTGKSPAHPVCVWLTFPWGFFCLDLESRPPALHWSTFGPEGKLCSSHMPPRGIPITVNMAWVLWAY